MSHSLLHVELTARTDDAFTLRFWGDNPAAPMAGGERVVQLAALGELQDQTLRIYDRDRPALAAIGQQLFGWLEGETRQLSQALNTLPVGRPVALCIASTERLSHLPWETLHDGTDFLINLQNRPVLPVRWHRVAQAPLPPENRALHILYMASSPENVKPVLEYELEEGLILEATQAHGIGLTTEETGCLNDLRYLVQRRGEGFFQVLHLTGHADHTQDGRTIFLLEDEAGATRNALPADLLDALPHRPPLIFLSGCRTGQAPSSGSTRSFAESLVKDGGCRAVLGWGRPVYDTNAIKAAASLYERLAAGEDLVPSLVATLRQLLNDKMPHWHLLRLFTAGDPPHALVTPADAPGRAHAVAQDTGKRYLDEKDPEGGVQVPERGAFVGRRRPLQRCVRALRDPQRHGCLITGLGGAGKSSLASRLLDRLADTHQPLVIFGTFTPSILLSTFTRNEDNAELKALLQKSGDTTSLLRSYLGARVLQARRPWVIVLDDFEQNQPVTPGQDAAKGIAPKPEAVESLQALFAALRIHPQAARLIITSRYALPLALRPCLHLEPLARMDPLEVEKKLLRLADQLTAREADDPVGRLPLAQVDEALLAHARLLADGNPRLLEWLVIILTQPELDHDVILQGLESKAAEFRLEFVAETLLNLLPLPTRQLLRALALYELPVPLEAVDALAHVSQKPVLARLTQALNLGLVEQEIIENARHYRLSRILLPLLESTETARPEQDLREAVFAVLEKLWWQESTAPEIRELEVLRLALAAGINERAIAMGDSIATRWNNANRWRESRDLCSMLINTCGRDHRLLLSMAMAQSSLGEKQAAQSLIEEAAATCPESDGKARGEILFHLASEAMARGELDEALPLLEQSAHLDRQMGDERGEAVTQGRIADILMARGQLDEALRIRQQEQLPVYTRLGDVRSLAVTQGQIADILMARGQLDEALRIRQQEELPVYTRLGDVRSLAVTHGQIADITALKGNLDEAIRIKRENEWPIYVQLGDIQCLIVGRVEVAQLLLQRGKEEDFPEAIDMIAWAWREARKRGLRETGQIEKLWAHLGGTTERLAGIAQQLPDDEPPASE